MFWEQERNGHRASLLHSEMLVFNKRWIRVVNGGWLRVGAKVAAGVGVGRELRVGWGGAGVETRVILAIL